MSSTTPTFPEVTYPAELITQAKMQGCATLFEASGLENCAVDPEIRSIWQGAQLAAPAFPVHCAPGDNLAIQVALEVAPRGSVLVVTTENFIAGYWGEVLTVAAQSAGLLGLVIDGGVRDTAAIRAKQFPVFTRGISVRGTRKACVPSVGEPIHIGGAPVHAGDLVVADDDGVVILPQAHTAKIIEKGQQREAKEAVMMQQLDAGKTSLELMGLSAWSLRNDT